ncbi:MAG: hypothetical protein EBX44_14855 [Betaproteobacteria bacterium]|nr:hypothetical protein [Betaproteobacteria bacterium]
MQGLLNMLPMRRSDGGRSPLETKSHADFLDCVEPRVGLGLESFEKRFSDHASGPHHLAAIVRTRSLNSIDIKESTLQNKV